MCGTESRSLALVLEKLSWAVATNEMEEEAINYGTY
jgi:hypothetical protein